MIHWSTYKETLYYIMWGTKDFKMLYPWETTMFGRGWNTCLWNVIKYAGNNTYRMFALSSQFSKCTFAFLPRLPNLCTYCSLIVLLMSVGSAVIARFISTVNLYPLLLGWCFCVWFWAFGSTFQEGCQFYFIVFEEQIFCFIHFFLVNFVYFWP